MTIPEVFYAAVEYAARMHREEKNRLGVAVKEAHRAGLSVTDIAKAAKVHRSTIYIWLKETNNHDA